MDERPRCNKKVDDILLRKFLRILIPGRLAPRVGISAIDVLFSDHPKCLDLIFIYSPGLMISIGNLRLLKHASIADK